MRVKAIDWKQAAIAGVVGTVVFDVVGLVFTQTWWDIPMLLGDKLGGGLLVGVVAHYLNGLLIAAIYAGVGPSLWGSNWARALLFMTAQTIFGVGLFMMPLLGMGVMGINMGIMMPVIGMLRHWGYGAALALLYPVTEAAPAQATTEGAATT